jgi:hypothetical protein
MPGGSVELLFFLASSRMRAYEASMSDSNVSRMVADRVAISNTVITAVRIHGPEVAPIVEKVLFPNGPPNNLTVAQVIDAIGTYLERGTTTLVQADRAHTTELADDEGIRQHREECMIDLKDFLSALRTNIIRNYGAVVAGAYSLGAALPDDGPALLLLADNVENLLRSRALSEPAKNQSLKLDPLVAANDVKANANALRVALANVEREKREAQLTQNDKAEAMAAWGTTYSASADAAAAFLALGGRLDLAQRVRPTARRRAGLPDEEAAPTPAAPPPENVPNGTP